MRSRSTKLNADPGGREIQIEGCQSTGMAVFEALMGNGAEHGDTVPQTSAQVWNGCLREVLIP